MKISIQIKFQTKNMKIKMKSIFASKQVNDQIIKHEMNIVNNNGFKSEQYISSLKLYINNYESIRKHIELISNFKKNVENFELFPIDFGEVITKNYLKIVSNIYYLNMRRVQINFRKYCIEKKASFKDEKELYDIINNLYSKYLKETREEVKKFFDIPEHKDFDLKILLRLYYYYLNPFDQNRIRMDEINDEVNRMLTNMSQGYEYPLMLNDDKPSSITKPVDVVLDFKKNVFKEEVKIKEFKIEEDHKESNTKPKVGGKTITEENYEKLRRILQQSQANYGKEN